MIIRRDFVNKLLEDRKENLRVVSGIGTSTWDLMSTGDEKNNFGFIWYFAWHNEFLSFSSAGYLNFCINICI